MVVCIAAPGLSTTNCPSPVGVLHAMPQWLSLTETWLFNQLRHLPLHYCNWVVCDQVDNLEHFPPPNLRCLADQPAWQRTLTRMLRRLGLDPHLARACQLSGSRILHSHYGDLAWRNMRMARLMGQRHLVTFYGYDVNFLPQQDSHWLSRYAALFRHVDRILCEGPHMGRCLEKLGAPPSKIQVHHLGVELDRLMYRPRCYEPGTPLKVLMAGSFREKKGLPDAIRALGALSRLGAELELTVIGDANREARSQVEKANILAALRETGLEGKTRLLGYQPHPVMLSEAYAHHVFLSPSRTAADGDTEGGAPVSIIEMAATGMPVVSTTHCDIPEVLHPGEHGLLAAEGDVPGLTVHLRWLVDHPESWSRLTGAARQHLEREFDAVRQGERLGELYCEVLEEQCP